ncbi:cysteine proteinase [Schizopora paradoxa]|uniref:Ubiquitin carboxyl-terminal hydrolase n=1 Tax=Schizopora paradoxa TaxID=27342 RepID=A0A0H2S760_9AGAM|nr:cysteine proteinase [Schizopora paradoxa]
MAFVGKWIGLGASQGAGGQNSTEDTQGEDSSKSQAIAKAEYKRFGLENFGNTCYANSVLQALYFCHPFRELVIQAPDSSNPIAPVVFSPAPPPPPTPPQTQQRIKNVRKPSSPDVRQAPDVSSQQIGVDKPTGPVIPLHPPSMFSALRALFVHISHNSLDKGIVAPRAFIEKLKKENEAFRTPMHQDAHEFLNFLLNKVAEDLQAEAGKERSRSPSGEDLLSNSVASSGPSTLGSRSHSSSSSSHSTLVQDLFEGILTSETRCLTCETVSSREEAFLDLSIDIEQNSSVTACLRQFSASEMLCQKNKFFCDSCCGLQEAEKRMKIKRLPNVLALHLKRFKYQENLQKYIKLTYRVAFPLELRLFNTVDDADDPDRLYELFAIVVHIGNGPNHGHYVAIVKSRGVWVIFDDDAVDTIKEADIPKYFGDSNSGCAYVLYYQAVDLDASSLGLRTADPEPCPPPSASAQQTPDAPPGLSHEEDSDASEPVPLTPAPALDLTSPPVKETSSPPLSVSIPSPESPQPAFASSTSNTPSSPNVKNGRFSLRHSPSKPNFAIRSDAAPPAAEPVPPVPTVPPIPTVKVHTEPDHPSASTLGSSTSTGSGKKSWFHWKSSKSSAKQSHRTSRPSEPPASQTQHDRSDDVSVRTSSTSSRAPLTGSSPINIPNGHGHHEPDPITPKEHIPSEGRPSSHYSPSSSRVNLHEPSKEVPPPVPELQQPEPPKAPFVPGHKKSQASFGSGSTAPPMRPARSERRPVTANAAPTSHSEYQSPPNFPGMPSSVPAVPMAIPRQSAQSTSTSESGDGVRRRNSVAVGAHSRPPPTSPMKRAPRKLSFSSGMLGFGRKDKDKDRHQARETESSPGTFPPLTA